MMDNVAGKPAVGELIKAIVDNDIKAAEALLRRGADFTAENPAGWDRLTSAASYGRPEIVQLLINAGAGVNRQSREGVTALMRAVRMGHTEVMRVLLENGADMSLCDNSGSTAHDYKPLKGRAEVKKMLEEEMVRLERCRVAEGLHAATVQKQQNLKGRMPRIVIRRGQQP